MSSKRLVRTIWAAFAAFCLSGAAQAERLNRNAAHRIDELFDDYDRPDSAGCALGIIRDGQFVYRNAYGMGSLELGVPLTAESVFYMGSVSKQFTAASVVLAAQQGRLTLDDDVRRWLPELPDYGTPITIRHLLHHTSGLRDFYTLMGLAGERREDRHTTPELLDLISRQRALNFEPGSQYSYSNSNYLLLAEIVKRATGMPLSQFASENIFQPLGMAHTRFYDDANLVLPNRVPAYQTDGNGGFSVGWTTSFDQVGAGGLMSSIDDLLLWDRNFYNPIVGGEAFLREMRTTGALNDGTPINMALGLLIGEYRGLPIEEFNGALFSYRTALYRFPEQHVSVALLCNTNADMIGLAHQVVDVLLERDLEPLPTLATLPNAPISPRQAPPAPPPVSIEDLAAIAGRYYSAEVDATYRLSVDEDHLVLELGWNDPISFTALSRDVIVSSTGARFSVRRGDRDQIVGLNASYGAVRDITFDRR